MKSLLRIAASQFPVSGSVARNARYIETQMKEASKAKVQVIHFPEGALSGYGHKHFESIESYEWDVLANHTQRICELASSLNLWTVFGSMRQIERELPRNCLHVVSNRGVIAGTYDKQRLTRGEKERYSPGSGPLVIEINGVKCGFLICYDNCFPELYDTYRNMEVGLLFQSFYNAGNSHANNIKDLAPATHIVRAADNQMWISSSNSSERYSPILACIVRPDGSMVRAKRHVTGITIDNYPEAKLGWTYNNRIV